MVHAHFWTQALLSLVAIDHIWPLLTFNFHEGRHRPKLASTVLLSKYGGHSALFIILTSVDLLTFDFHEGHHHPKLASAILLTKFGSLEA